MIYIKLVLGSMIIAITTYIGFYKASKLKSREYILNDMITFLTLLKDEMIYMMTTLPDAYESARQKINSSLKECIGSIVVDMLKTDNMELVNQSIVNNVSLLDELYDYDKNIIISTLKNLGRGDVELQVNIINNTISILQTQVKEACEIKNKNAKMYKTIGIIAGMMLVIIFI